MLRDIKALVADDDPFVGELIGEILRSEGCSVETAGDGREAYDKFLADPDIHIVISDMHMPGMNGLQLIEKFRRLKADVPIIILTGMAAASEAVNKGATAYVMKDEYLQETLVRTVRQVLDMQLLKKNKANNS